MIAPRTKTSALQQRLDAFEPIYAAREPRLHAFIAEAERFRRLRREAAALERKNKKPARRGMLFGLLLGVKDIFHVDGFPTQAGSRLPARVLHGPEATSVSQLKKAGMLVAGKTVTTEFAFFPPGPTRNPHNPEHTPGGSSSGSAAAVAAGLVDLALGTQTIGSIIRPASYCGVVGFKPSYGRISTAGVIPLARSLDHVGLFAHEVTTINMAAPVLLQNWKPATRSAQKPSLAIPSGAYLTKVNGEMREHFEKIVEGLKATGYGLRTLDPFRELDDDVERHNLILAAETAQAHSAWYETYKHLYHEKTSALIEKGFAISEATLKTAREGARNFGRNLNTLMDIHGIDLWLSPAATGAAPKGLTSTGDPIMNLPWTQAGFPTLGLPSGYNAERLPLGIQLSAGNGRDEDLLVWGAGIEAVLSELM